MSARTGRYERAAQLLEAELGEELLGLDGRAGLCFGFNSVAADVWRLLESPRRFDELHSVLLEVYDVDPDTCATDLAELLELMCSEGLVQRRA